MNETLEFILMFIIIPLVVSYGFFGILALLIKSSYKKDYFVIYKDGARSKRMTQRDARNYAEIFGGIVCKFIAQVDKETI